MGRAQPGTTSCRSLSCRLVAVVRERPRARLGAVNASSAFAAGWAQALRRCRLQTERAQPKMQRCRTQSTSRRESLRQCARAVFAGVDNATVAGDARSSQWRSGARGLRGRQSLCVTSEVPLTDWPSGTGDCVPSSASALPIGPIPRHHTSPSLAPSPPAALSSLSLPHSPAKSRTRCAPWSLAS